MTEPRPTAEISRPRAIRVFVSSTFRDMHDEREELIKRIFPQLRKLCESRGVVWSEVDLRWGIPDEAKAEGQVLPICLAEIQRCRPYFIGLLGERYGWVPEEISPDLIAQEPWLQERPGRPKRGHGPVSGSGTPLPGVEELARTGHLPSQPGVIIFRRKAEFQGGPAPGVGGPPPGRGAWLCRPGRAGQGHPG